MSEILQVKQETVTTDFTLPAWKPKPILPKEPTDRRVAGRQLLGAYDAHSGRRASTARRSAGTSIWVTVGFTADDLVVVAQNRIKKAAENGRISTRTDYWLDQVQSRRDGFCTFGANRAKTGGYCGSRLLSPTNDVPFPPVNWHPALNCSLDDPDAQLYATPTSVSTCCARCRSKVTGTVGSVSVIDTEARFNNAYLEANRSGIEHAKGVSVWFLVGFGGICVLLAIGALHLYIMLKHGWQKSDKPPTWSEIEDWMWGGGQEEGGWEEESGTESSYKPPRVSYGDDEEGQILQAATEAGIDMNDSAALSSFTIEWKRSH